MLNDNRTNEQRESGLKEGDMLGKNDGKISILDQVNSNRSPIVGRELLSKTHKAFGILPGVYEKKKNDQ